MTAHALKYGDFIGAYKKAQNKDEEIIAFMNAFQQIVEDQQENVAKSKEELLKEIRIEDLATKYDLDALDKKLENKMLQQELRIMKEITSSKWQVIGSVAFMLFAEIALKHFGI